MAMLHMRFVLDHTHDPRPTLMRHYSADHPAINLDEIILSQKQLKLRKSTL